MKRIDFIEMMLQEGLDNTTCSLIQPARCDEPRYGVDYVAYQLGLHLEDYGITVYGDFDTDNLSRCFVGVVYEYDTDEDIRFAAGYRPNVELRKGRDSICLYCLGRRSEHYE